MTEPWYKRTFLWGQVNLTENDPQDCDMEFWKAYWKKTGVEGVIINCGGIVSYYQSRFSYQYRAEGLGEKDFFAVWNQAARQMGLTVIARMDINATARRMYEKHPEWYCRDAGGEPVLSQGRYVACVNGGYYQEFIPKVFAEIITQYHPDGFADNSWAGPGMDTICYCENCRRQFRETYGLELPRKKDWQDDVYRKWVKWNFETRVRNWNYFNQITTRWGGADCRWFGMLNADPFATGGRFYDIKKLVQDMPFLFCDHQSRDRANGFEQNALNGALLRLACSENVVVAESMAHYYKGERTFRLSAGQRQEVRKWMMTGLAGGIAPWFHFVGGGTLDRRKFHISDDIFQWLGEKKQYFRDRINIANVGVVWNQESAVYYGREAMAKRSAACFKGMTEGLSRAGIPFIPIHADDIAAYADRLQLLILPNVAILSRQQEDSILNWLESGKHLIFTDDTGLYDEEGNWKGPGRLQERLGLLPEEEMLGTTGEDTDNWMVQDTHNYLKVSEKMHPFYQGTPDTDLLPFGGRIRSCKTTGRLKAIAGYIPAFPIYPPEFSWIREQSDAASVFAGTLENGARVMYMAADLDRCYHLNHIPDHRKLLEGAVRWAGGNTFPVTVCGPGHVNCNAYRQGKKLIIHLVNLAGCNGPVGSLEENLPIGPVTVYFQGTEKIGKAESLVSGMLFEAGTENGCSCIRLPRLEEQEMLLIQIR